MAILAGSGQLIRWVVGIHSRIVIGLVTTYTSVGRIVVIPVVAIIAGSSLVRSVQWPIGVVDREGSRFPIRRRGMAHRTIRREIQCQVLWILACIVIRGMATRTSIGCVVVIAVVTGIAIIGNRNMRSGERINRIVVKR